MTASGASKRADGKVLALSAIALALLTFALYHAVGGHAFLRWDDPSYVSQNPIVLKGLTWAGVRWSFTSTHSTNWHPLTTLSHMLDCQLFGADAGWHHLVNAALHALNAALCLIFFWCATGRRWASLFIACAFAWHPQRVESVAWISERKDLLAGAFFFLCLLLYLRQRSSCSRRSSVALGCVFLLGLLSKPSLVTLPFLLVILDRWPLAGNGGTTGRSESSKRRTLRARLPLFALAGAVAAVTWFVQRASGNTLGAEELTMLERASNAVESYGRYVLQTCVPLELSYFYPHPGLVDPEWTPWNGAFFLSALCLAGITLLAFAQRRRHPAALAGWLWFLLILVPMIGIVQVGEHARADRYTYLSSIGLFALVALGPLGAAPRSRLATRLRAGAAAVALAGCCALTAREIEYWKDSEGLFRRALVTTERNHMAHSGLGNVLRDAGLLDEARECYATALEIRPGNPIILFNLGVLEQGDGRLADAAALYQRALRKDPDLVNAHLNLAAVRSGQNRLPEAIDLLARVLQSAARGSVPRSQASENLRNLIRSLEAHLATSPTDPEALALCAQARAALEGRSAGALDPH